MQPRLSFGLPVYNGEHYLGEAIDSVLAQDEDSWELFISDNGSTDGTESICRAAAARDLRVRYERQDVNRGGHWNFQHVLDEARAPHFTWICADDRKTASFASACLAVLDGTGPETVMAYTRTRLIDCDGREIGPIHDDRLGLDDPRPHVRVARLLGASASSVFYGVVRTDVARATRGVRPSVAVDIVFLTELACRGLLRLADGATFEFRRHDEQASAQGARQMSFYRPAGSPRFAFQNSRANVEILAAVRASPLPAAETARTMLAAGSSWIVPRWRPVARVTGRPRRGARRTRRAESAPTR